MKVIICGAGQVGYNIARQLAAEDNDVTIIDQSAELIQKINDSLEVRAIRGFGSQPDVLEQAEADGADMLIAVTQSDEVNMMACQVAHTLFEVPLKIARIRNQAYLSPLWSRLFSRERIPIDHIISPEMEVAASIARRMEVPGALDVISLHNDLVKVVGVLCTENCPLLHTPLRQLTALFPDLDIEIVAMVRGDRMFVPTADEQMVPDDEVYFAVATKHLARAMSAFGYEEPQAKRVVVLGGGNVGYFLTREVEKRYPRANIRIIEADRARAQLLAQKVERAIVLLGDGLDEAVFEEANVAASDLFVAVTNNDETNILGGLLAKRSGARRAVVLTNKGGFAGLSTGIGLDAVVSPRSITVSRILQHVRRGRIKAVHSLRDGGAEIIEAEALETTELINRPIGTLNLPKDSKIGAIVRDDEVIIPRPSTEIRAGDSVVMLALPTAIKKVEKLFSVRIEFFI